MNYQVSRKHLFAHKKITITEINKISTREQFSGGSFYYY